LLIESIFTNSFKLPVKMFGMEL